jgi:rSAM/selenodomain-associated transferase 2
MATSEPTTFKSSGISIVIPVLEESEIINGLIAYLRAIDPGGAAEIIVVDGDPDGSTIGTVRDQEVLTLTAPRGRASQMNAGANRACGSVLLFLHADTRIPSDGLLKIEEVMARGVSVGGAFDLGINAPGLAFRIIERTASIRSRLTRVPFGDQAIFVRRDYFHTRGGFPNVPLMEDVLFMSRIKAGGDRIVILPARAQTSARRWEKRGILSRTLRNWYVQVLYLAGVSPERLARIYR